MLLDRPACAAGLTDGIGDQDGGGRICLFRFARFRLFIVSMGDGAHDETDGGPSPAAVGTSGGWTVVGPDGRVRTFSSRDDVLASLAESNEVTAAPPEVELGPRRLSLVPEEDPPPLPSKARRRSKPAEPPPQEVAEGVDSAEPVESSNVLAAISVEKPPSSAAESIHSVDMLDSTDSTDSLEESGPTSSDLQPEPSVRPPAVAMNEAKELPHRDDASEGELVSLRDMVVVVPAVEQHPHDDDDPHGTGRSSSVPPPPKAGALRTLPPPPRKTAPAPPPPTITVASTPPPAVDTRPSRSVPTRSAPAPAAAKNGWLMPVAICAVLAAVILYATRGPTPAPVVPTANDTTAREPAAGATTPAVAATTPSTTLAPRSSASTAASASGPVGSASAGGGLAAGAGGATPASGPRPAGTEVDSQLALSEVLTRAGTARRGGDAARAKALYERALVLSAGNAEAYGGLAEVARAQGDLAGAKASYERALATSPGYGPALLGLADVQWDLGEHDAAQRRYRELLGSSSSPPERAKERASGGATASAPASATAAPAPAPAPEE